MTEQAQVPIERVPESEPARQVVDLRPETLQVATLPESGGSRTAPASLPQADVSAQGITFSPTRQWFNDMYRNWGQSRRTEDMYNNWGDATPGADQGGSDQQRQQRLNANRAIAENPAASVSDKLKAFTSLYADLPKDANGRARITLKDGGQDREFTIERPKVGNVNLTQVFARDDQGKDHVVLRAVERGEGRFERQKDRSGNNVEYVGRWWTQNHSSSTVARTSDGAAPVVPPERRREQGGDPPPRGRRDPAVPPEGGQRRADPVVPPEGGQRRADPVVPPEGGQRRRDPVVPPEGGRRDPVVPPDDGRRHRPRPPQEGDNGGRVPGERQPESDTSPASLDLTRNRFYLHQQTGFGCGPYSLAMAKAHHMGYQPSAAEATRLEHTTGTRAAGRFPGSLDTMARHARNEGLESRAYTYSGANGRNRMDDLDRELAQGHSAMARVINPHTGNPHWIYVAGKDRNGNYVIGDPDRHNNGAFGHDRPVGRNYLYNLMSRRDGFVAVWRRGR